MKQGPETIQYYPTLRCDRSCGFCFNRGMPLVADATLDRFRLMLDRLTSRGLRSLDIIGGEPTLHRDLEAMVHDAAARGLIVNISSNGSNPRVLRRLMKVSGRVMVGISINDRETLSALAGFIGSERPVVKTLFTPGLDRSLVDDILSLKPRTYFLIYRDAARHGDLAGTLPFDRFLEATKEHLGIGRVGRVFCSGFIPEYASLPELAGVRCPAGTIKLGVLPDGSVYPCNLFFGRPGFLLGNVLSDPFDSIWHNPVLARFRRFSVNGCPRRDCVLHRSCHGGCPAEAHARFGDMDAPDPRCILPADTGKI